MVTVVRQGCPGSRGGWAGWVAGVLRVYVDVWMALVGLGRAGRCRVSWRPADGDGGRMRGAEWVSGRHGHARHGNG